MSIIEQQRSVLRTAGDETVPLWYVYSESYVRVGKRKTETVNFWAKGLVVVRTLDPDETQPAYRIVDPVGCENADYTIREIDGAFWWPLLYSGRLLSPSLFRELAEAGDRDVLHLLHIGGRWPLREDRTTHYKNIALREHLGDTRAELQRQAQVGAAEIIFCGDMVLVEAGMPIYYALPVSQTVRNRVVAGPSKPERLSDGGFGVSGPSGHAAVRCLRAAQAFDLHEIDLTPASSSPTSDAGDIVARIETLSSLGAPCRSAAILACARAFVELAFADSTLDHPLCRLLRANVMSFQEAGHNFAKFRQIPSETVLEEIASISDPKLIQAHPSRLTDAARLLSRLRSASRPALSDEEEEALASIV